MCVCRRLLEESDPLSKVAFPLPSDALASAPVPSRAATSASPEASGWAGAAPAPQGAVVDPVLQATGLDALTAAHGRPCSPSRAPPLLLSHYWGHPHFSEVCLSGESVPPLRSALWGWWLAWSSCMPAIESFSWVWYRHCVLFIEFVGDGHACDCAKVQRSDLENTYAASHPWLLQ